MEPNDSMAKEVYLNNHTIDKNMHDMACFHFGDCRSEMRLKLTSFMKIHVDLELLGSLQPYNVLYNYASLWSDYKKY